MPNMSGAAEWGGSHSGTFWCNSELPPPPFSLCATKLLKIAVDFTVFFLFFYKKKEKRKKSNKWIKQEIPTCKRPLWKPLGHKSLLFVWICLHLLDDNLAAESSLAPRCSNQPGPAHFYHAGTDSSYWAWGTDEKFTPGTCGRNLFYWYDWLCTDVLKSWEHFKSKPEVVQLMCSLTVEVLVNKGQRTSKSDKWTGL